MRNNKLAFTLAEVLITLAIVGVVATLLIPQLVDKTKKAQYSATLGRAVQQIELGIGNIINDSGDMTATLDIIQENGLLPDDGTDITSSLIDEYNLLNNNMDKLDLTQLDDSDGSGDSGLNTSS